MENRHRFVHHLRKKLPAALSTWHMVVTLALVKAVKFPAAYKVKRTAWFCVYANGNIDSE